MKRFAFLLIIITVVMPIKADNNLLLEKLDSVISNKTQYMKAKEERIAFLKGKLSQESMPEDKMHTLEELYNEYYVFQFDSAMAYANRGEALAKDLKNAYYVQLFTIYKSEIMAIGGLYNEAVENLNGLHTEKVNTKLLFKYHLAFFTIYTYWADYCHDQVFAPLYRDKARNSLKMALENIHADNPLYEYYQGERHVYIEPDSKRAKMHYQNVLNHTDESLRPYAMAAFALAGSYSVEGINKQYEEYAIKAAIADVKGCTMENMALQSLAMHLFQQGKAQLERAERYINISMEDAKFYNNRLRIIEISRILPQIMSTYQTTMKKQNRNLRSSILFISLLVIGLVLGAYYIYRQNKKLASRRRELAKNNQQLKNLNQQLADSNNHQANLNEQLKELNKKLIDTNKRREGLASIYIDLCAKYIDKLGKYQTLVKRKIKANQVQELLSTMSSTRISEEDAAIFLNRFDKAFLELYPTFVDEFNSLLKDDAHIVTKSPHVLNTELRTFALIRLGVKNTADIAGLLFLSPQTIYNCRSVIKNKAVNKDTFDADVQKLCTVIIL